MLGEHLRISEQPRLFGWKFVQQQKDKAEHPPSLPLSGLLISSWSYLF